MPLVGYFNLMDTLLLNEYCSTVLQQNKVTRQVSSCFEKAWPSFTEKSAGYLWLLSTFN